MHYTITNKEAFHVIGIQCRTTNENGQAKKDIERGKLIYEVLSQKPGEYFSVMDQQLMLQVVLDVDGAVIDVEKMKAEVGLLSKDIQTDE